ncbi:unnamed protein product [Cunninghamella blakesleeana]
MGSVYNATTKDTYTLKINTPLILGRNLVNKKDLRISRSHVQIILLDDQRCFVKALSQNACTLDNAILPKKITDQGKEEGEEIEAFDGQWIHLLPENLYPFKLNLPKSLNDDTSPPPRKPLFQHKKDTDDESELENNSDQDDHDDIENEDMDNINDINNYNNQIDDDDNDNDNYYSYSYTFEEKARYHYSSNEEDENEKLDDDNDDNSIISTESSLIGEED